MKRCWLVVLLLFFIPLCAFTQKQASVWYFGDHAGLDFRNGEPVALTDGALSTEEGSASICDEEGNLLFYTDGVTVYNRLHQIMPNGRNLWGSYTTTQTLIVPKPGNDPIYYIFTASPQYDYIFGPGTDSVGLHYSVVDMSLDGGFGNISDKNILLFKNTTEKITAVHHANGKDIWVVTHEWESNKFRSYLITGNGIVAEPVISEVGIVHKGDGTTQGSRANSTGQLKLSPDGAKLTLAISDVGIFLYDFNKETGDITNQMTIKKNPNFSFYGIEFSSNSQYVYFTDLFGNCNSETEKSSLYQYSIENNSVEKVGQFIGVLGALQLAKDGRIYGSQCNYLLNNGSSKLAVLLFPNRPSNLCGFVENYLSLRGRNNPIGTSLPNFIQSYFLFSDPSIEMPNVFTANGDVFNPAFKPIQFNNIIDAKLKILNRWGEEIFETIELQKGWDGESSPSGVYYWMVYYEGKNGKKGMLKGWVHLLR